ncbi:MAG TPA: hypothetical protein VFX98_19345 [Longimicrobiaceae bacterium]|nr:hypothetical protein [Longimicrobiaceae bacterium]
MNLTSAIETFNESSQPQIELRPGRDGRVTASLPRVGREILVEGSQFKEEVKVTASDVAWLAEEARRASAPGLALLEAALGALGELDEGNS